MFGRFHKALRYLVSLLYPITNAEKDKVESFLNTPYRSNAAQPNEPLFPVIEKQRTLHHWDWAPNAPEKGVPNNLRHTSICQVCKLCGTFSMMSHLPPYNRYLIGLVPMFTPQPICPSTCQEAIELMKQSPMSSEEKRRCFREWDSTLVDVSKYKFE